MRKAEEILEACYQEEGRVFEWVAITKSPDHFRNAIRAIEQAQREAIEEERAAILNWLLLGDHGRNAHLIGRDGDADE